MSVKKSLYVFLCSLLGILLFLVLHQIAVFGYLMLIYFNYSFSFGMSLVELMALDYVTLVFVLFFGAWYGIWVGEYWYEEVYEGQHPGFLGHLVRHYWPTKESKYNLRSKIVAAEQKLEGDLWELEDLTSKAQSKTKVVGVRKRVVRRKATLLNTKLAKY